MVKGHNRKNNSEVGRLFCVLTGRKGRRGGGTYHRRGERSVPIRSTSRCECATIEDMSDNDPISEETLKKQGRAARRQAWPVRRVTLQSTGGDDISATSTPAERLAMVWALTLEAWELSGLPVPDYERQEIPVRRTRLRDQ